MNSSASEPRPSEFQISGFERYAFGKDFILESDSWIQAQAKIRHVLAGRKEIGVEVAFYYDGDGAILWREYQFLFLCQLLEFRLAEFLSHLATQGKIVGAFLKRLQKSQKADPKRAKKVTRLMSPASLLVDFGYALGSLIVILSKQSLDFANKANLIEQLEAFNRNRISFIHHSFNTKNKAKTVGVRETLDLGLQKGVELLALLDNLIKSVHS
jgi:hypothetical protein